MAELLDTVRSMETPEGVRLDLPVAGPVPRGVAWCLDQLLRGVFYLLLAMPLTVLGDLGIGLFMVAAFLLEWFYPVLFEVLWRGATPGKRAMGLAVVQDDGTPVTWSTSIVRNLLRFADFLPFAYLAGLASMVMQRDFKRLGDLVAGTIVVHREPRRASPTLPRVAPVPVPFALSPREQRAIVEYAERSHGWTGDRVEELAEVLVPVVGAPPRQAARTLFGMARWLQGEREEG